MGYLSQVKAGGKQYIYLTEYCGHQEFTTKIEKHIFSFGSPTIAISKMHRWQKDFSEFPSELLGKGYGLNDLESWIKTLQTGVTPNGRRFKVKNRAAI